MAFVLKLENARVALVGRVSEVLECARAFKRRRIAFRISIDYILELLARFARSPIIEVGNCQKLFRILLLTSLLSVNAFE